MIVLYITRNGRDIAKSLKRFYGNRLATKKVEKGNLNEVFSEAFKYKRIIAVMAVGIVVRAISSLIKNKVEDPAIVVVDERGKYAISLLSGHMGGANELAIEVAEKLGAEPVITTSSDVQGYKALDLYAKEKGYLINDMTLYRKVAKLMADGRKIPLYVEKSEDDDYFASGYFKKCESLHEFINEGGIKIAVTWRNLEGRNILYIIPRKLVAGIGFHRGMSSDELLSFVKMVCSQEGIYFSAIKKISTIDKRKGEKGLYELAKLLDAELFFYKTEDLKRALDRVEGSKNVEKYHGVGNVSETSALLCSNFGHIIVPKKKGGMITLCIALENSL
ncbi:MAG: cobalamin biosynthesis protein [Proteobacteria bacterium]|nr:cobalamin biosynthesis protein [Pseudomonadota bacterium]